MRERFPVVSAAACGILGVLALVASFNVNPGPPANASIAQIVEFGKQYRDSILVGAWLQGIGSLLNVVFVLALVHLAGYADRFLGRLTLLAGVTILNVSLVEIAFYLTAVQSGESGDLGALATSLQLIKGVQHVFLIAPALLLPVGLAIIGSTVLPRIFGLLAVTLGVTLEILGFVGLFSALQSVIDVVLIVQEVWMLAAAVALLARGPASRPALSRSEAAITSS
jgi:hypothetical protein